MQQGIDNVEWVINIRIVSLSWHHNDDWVVFRAVLGCNGYHQFYPKVLHHPPAFQRLSPLLSSCSVQLLSPVRTNATDSSCYLRPLAQYTWYGTSGVHITYVYRTSFQNLIPKYGCAITILFVHTYWTHCFSRFVAICCTSADSADLHMHNRTRK